MVAAALIVLLGFAALSWVAIRAIPDRRQVPDDLRRADSPQDQAPFDPRQANEAARGVFWRM